MLQVLEHIAAGAPLSEALEAIVQRFETLHPGTFCSVLLVSDGKLVTAAAPSLPAVFNAAVDGLPIAEGSAVCGTAAARRESVIVNDLLSDPLMVDYRELAAAHGLRSAWSTPVISTSGDVVATFAIYRRDQVAPDHAQREHVADAARLVRIVMEREDALAQRRTSESLLQLAGKVAHLGAWAVELPTMRVTWSEETARIHKKPHAYVPSLDEGINNYAPEHRERIRAVVERCATDGTPWDVNAELLLEDGSRVFVRVMGAAVRDARGKITAVQGAIQDVTDLRLAESERRSLAEKLQRTLESITDGVILIDRDWIIQFANPEASRLVRRKRESLEGQSFWVAFPDTIGSEFERAYRQAVATGESVQVEGYYAPLEGWFEVHAAPSPEGLSLYFRNSSERHESVARLAEQAALLDKARDAILVRKIDDSIVYWNQGAARLYGWTADEAIGQNARDLMNARSAEFDEAKRVVLAKGEWTGTLRQVTKDNGRVITECRWTLMRDDAGHPISILAINSDITERRNLEQQFLRAQRLESIGTLAGGIAHDLNNVLSPVMMSLDILHDMVGSNGSELINGLRRSVNRGADLVRQVLTFARGLDGRKERVDLRHIQRDIEIVVRDTFPKSIRWVSELPSETCNVMGDATQLHQVLMNLVVNARDAMPQGGTLKVSVKRAELSASAAQALGLSEGHYARLDVSDDGEGISPEHQEVIFEPFFTTKEVGQGTGIGLSTVQGIVRGHDGAITLESTLGKGSTFTCWFPLVNEDTEHPSAPTLARRLPRGSGECILVVDDEEAIRNVADRILTRHGYTVLTAGNGREALAMYRLHSAKIDAVITDVSMPEMDGPELIATLRAEGADIPIIVSSGYVEDAGAGRLLNAGTEFFISKPFTSEILLTTLRGVLVGRR